MREEPRCRWSDEPSAGAAGAGGTRHSNRGGCGRAVRAGGRGRRCGVNARPAAVSVPGDARGASPAGRDSTMSRRGSGPTSCGVQHERGGSASPSRRAGAAHRKLPPARAAAGRGKGAVARLTIVRDGIGLEERELRTAAVIEAREQGHAQERRGRPFRRRPAIRPREHVDHVAIAMERRAGRERIAAASRCRMKTTVASASRVTGFVRRSGTAAVRTTASASDRPSDGRRCRGAASPTRRRSGRPCPRQHCCRPFTATSRPSTRTRTRSTAIPADTSGGRPGKAACREHPTAGSSGRWAGNRRPPGASPAASSRTTASQIRRRFGGRTPRNRGGHDEQSAAAGCQRAPKYAGSGSARPGCRGRSSRAPARRASPGSRCEPTRCRRRGRCPSTSSPPTGPAARQADVEERRHEEHVGAHDRHGDAGKEAWQRLRQDGEPPRRYDSAQRDHRDLAGAAATWADAGAP